MSDIPKYHEMVGYDYVAAIREINEVMTYTEMCRALGYGSPQSISKILDGAIPSHTHGEALYALYRDLFDRKPPMTGRET